MKRQLEPPSGLGGEGELSKTAKKDLGFAGGKLSKLLEQY